MAPQVESGRDEKAFFAAIRSGDLEAVRESLQSHPELVRSHDVECFGVTPLIHACYVCDSSNFDMVDLLLNHGADIDARSDWWAGSWGVLDSGDNELADALLARGATLTPHAAARLGRLEDLRAMLDEDPARVHARGGDGKQPLHFARTPEIAELLLERGADIEARDLDHVSTPAQWLITERPLVARYLVESGARQDPVIACVLGDFEWLEESLGASGQPFRIDRQTFPSSEPAAGHIYLYAIGEGSTLLHLAALVNQVEAIAWLTRSSADSPGMDPNLRGGFDDATPLHQAAWHNQTEAARALIEAGADVDLPSGEIHKNEAIGWAIVAGSADVADLLIEHGCHLRDEHFEDARAGARGRFRSFQQGRPGDAAQRIADRFAERTS